MKLRSILEVVFFDAFIYNVRTILEVDFQNLRIYVQSKKQKYTRSSIVQTSLPPPLLYEEDGRVVGERVEEFNLFKIDGNGGGRVELMELMVWKFQTLGVYFWYGGS